ncbi:MAG: DoxX family protein [Roseivirga sp.]|nr:DoxX family protein [Roseivirga sp.]
MIKKLIEPNETLATGLVIVRVLTGGIIISFGFEMFTIENMEGYTQWLSDLKVPAPQFMAYLGKIAELVCGTMLLLGLFTRLASIPLMITMVVINFVMSEGHLRAGPFYLLLLFAVFFFVGGGRYSVDALIRKRKESRDSKT